MKAKWYGPKQILMIVFTGILLLIDASIVGGSTNTVLPAMAEAHGWDANFLNIFAGLGCVLDGVGVLFWAKFARKSAKKLAAAGLFLQAACLVVFGYTNNLGVLILMILVMGLAGSMFASTAVMTLTANWWPTKKAIVLGYSTMGIILMSIVYAPYIPVAFAAIGIGPTNLWLAVAIAVMGVISLALVKDTPEEAGTTPDGMTGVSLDKAKEISRQLAEYKSPYTFQKLAKNPNNWCVAFAMGISLMVAMTFIATTIPALLSFQYDYGQAIAIFSVGGVAALAGSWILGMVDLKIGTKKTVVIFLVIMLVGAISCCLMPKAIMAAWVAGMIFMFTNGGAKNLLPSYVATIYGRWDYPAAYRMIGTIGLVMCGLGVMITGFFKSYMSMYIFDIVLVIIAIILAVIAKDKFIGKKDEMEA
ncbi:MAG: MFS transporter [Eubacterium sp.]|nr:MFS transporter [Eubacterium sp.]